jgi:hypothetical protein
VPENDPSENVEAQWYQEIANLLETAAARYRRFAGLLRVAGGALPESDFEAERLEIRWVTYRLGQIMQADADRKGGGVEP